MDKRALRLIWLLYLPRPSLSREGGGQEATQKREHKKRRPRLEAVPLNQVRPGISTTPRPPKIAAPVSGGGGEGLARDKVRPDGRRSALSDSAGGGGPRSPLK